MVHKFQLDYLLKFGVGSNFLLFFFSKLKFFFRIVKKVFLQWYVMAECKFVNYEDWPNFLLKVPLLPKFELIPKFDLIPKVYPISKFTLLLKFDLISKHDMKFMILKFVPITNIYPIWRFRLISKLHLIPRFELT